MPLEVQAVWALGVGGALAMLASSSGADAPRLPLHDPDAIGQRLLLIKVGFRLAAPFAED